MYFCTRACVCRCDSDVICICHDLNQCSGWWYVCCVNVEVLAAPKDTAYTRWSCHSGMANPVQIMSTPTIWSSKECVCCACDPSELLDASSHMFCLCFCMSEIISSFRSLRAGSQVFALLMLFLCVIVHTMSSGKSLQLLCILPFGMLSLFAISMMCVKNLLAVVYIGGMVV